MTIKEYLEEIRQRGTVNGMTPETITEMVLTACEIWSNEAAQGYAAKAARNLGLDSTQVEQLTDEMGVLFEEIDLEQAAAYYRNT